MDASLIEHRSVTQCAVDHRSFPTARSLKHQPVLASSRSHLCASKAALISLSACAMSSSRDIKLFSQDSQMPVNGKLILTSLRDRFTMSLSLPQVESACQPVWISSAHEFHLSGCGGVKSPDTNQCEAADPCLRTAVRLGDGP